MNSYCEFHARECHTTTRYEAPACMAEVKPAPIAYRVDPLASSAYANMQTIAQCRALVALMITWTAA